jgi:DeoR/GlpR family transcriptional regulator of sugar metabolism
MLTRERKTLILDRLSRDGRVVAKEMASELDLSEDTLRRDLRDLAGEGLLRRVHGGALPNAPELPDFAARKMIGQEEKRALGEFAAGLIEPGVMLFIDGGTTNEELVRALPQNTGFTVATHSPTIAALLETHANVEVILIGGRLYKHSMVALGSVAASAINMLRPDLFFMGVTGVHRQEGFTTGDYEEASIKRLISSRSRRTCVLATANKLGVASPVTILGADAADLIVSANTLPDQLMPLRLAGMHIVGEA